MADAVLSFPGGTVVVTESRIWEALDEFIAADKYHAVRNMTRKAGEYRVTLEWQRLLCSQGIATGRSMRTLADAVAHALQIYETQKHDDSMLKVKRG